MRSNHDNPNPEREFDFALIVAGVPELTDAVADALFEAGCDDATITMRSGLLSIEFSRAAGTIQDAILGAIRDVARANIGAAVVQVENCNLVSMSDIARRIGKSRQLVHQYITGERGPGGFPPPVCFATESKALWGWCAVSAWLASNSYLRPEESWNAEVVAAINNALEMARQRTRQPALVEEVNRQLGLAS